MARLSAMVVGGGVMGLAAGCALAGHGADVTLYERFTIAHDRASSHGLTRAIRHEYGPAALYTAMVTWSLALWDALARETGRRLYTETGVLTLGQPDDGHTLPGHDVMRAARLPVERLSAEECAARFPQFNATDYEAITYNPKGGMLHVAECMQSLAERLCARGGTLAEGARVRRVEAHGGHASVVMEDGEIRHADRVIVTAGPWVRDVLPELDLPVTPTRQQVCYLAGLDPDLFAVGRFPIFLAQMSSYGFPLQGSGWLKIGSHDVNPAVDPNEPYPPNLDEVAALRDFLRRVIPAAADGELALVDRCMYDMSPDEDFILDRYPGAEAVVIGSGFSGHGFKFGPLIGELLAALALDEEPPFPLERFQLARFNR